jgi:hypothetical protein
MMYAFRSLDLYILDMYYTVRWFDVDWLIVLVVYWSGFGDWQGGKEGRRKKWWHIRLCRGEGMMEWR